MKYNFEKLVDDAPLILASITLFVVLAFILLLTIKASYELLFEEQAKLECRDGKLFEATHEGSIIIYKPTFDDCEVK